MFENPRNLVTTPFENILPINLLALTEQPFQHFESVYEWQVRFIVRYDGKPIAALVPLIDLEMLCDLQNQVDANKWLEWVQDIRKRLGWPVVTFNEEEESQ